MCCACVTRRSEPEAGRRLRATACLSLRAAYLDRSNGWGASASARAIVFEQRADVRDVSQAAAVNGADHQRPAANKRAGFRWRMRAEGVVCPPPAVGAQAGRREVGGPPNSLLALLQERCGSSITTTPESEQLRCGRGATSPSGRRKKGGPIAVYIECKSHPMGPQRGLPRAMAKIEARLSKARAAWNHAKRKPAG